MKSRVTDTSASHLHTNGFLHFSLGLLTAFLKCPVSRASSSADPHQVSYPYMSPKCPPKCQPQCPTPCPPPVSSCWAMDTRALSVWQLSCCHRYGGLIAALGAVAGLGLRISDKQSWRKQSAENPQQPAVPLLFLSLLTELLKSPSGNLYIFS